MPFFESYFKDLRAANVYYYDTSKGIHIGYCLDPPRCITEKKAIEISNAIRSKPNWLIKSQNPEIVNKWKQEIKQQLQQLQQELELELGQEVPDDNEDNIITFVLDELQFYQRLRKETNNLFEAGCDDRIFLSVCDDSNDNKTLIPPELKQDFVSKVKRLLENVPDDKKDWHPNSNNQVLDLVHPSLYPLRYKISPVKQADGSYEPISMPAIPDSYGRDIQYLPSSYQWLPSVFSLHNVAPNKHNDNNNKNNNENQVKVTIDSYINNLDPVKCNELYQPLADIFAHCIPGIEAVLSRCVTQNYLRYPIGDSFYDPPDYPYQLETEILESLADENGDVDDDVHDANFGRLFDARILDKIIKPKLEYKEPEQTQKFNLVQKFDKLKVITKLANIELTPENPKYPGGTWHVEGTHTEDIIATVLYYYDIQNITTSTLSFRSSFGAPCYNQNDNAGTRVLYGMEDGDLQVLDNGSVEAIQDRVVVFPNKFQHRVDPFELQDKTKPGHRKILCFFLCDPTNENVCATDIVPPQQREWQNRQVHGSGMLNIFPPEILNNIVQNIQGSMSFQEACQVRQELMKERSNITSDIETYTSYFSLCEH